jgi:hypothetical protein
VQAKAKATFARGKTLGPLKLWLSRNCRSVMCDPGEACTVLADTDAGTGMCSEVQQPDLHEVPHEMPGGHDGGSSNHPTIDSGTGGTTGSSGAGPDASTGSGGSNAAPDGGSGGTSGSGGSNAVPDGGMSGSGGSDAGTDSGSGGTTGGSGGTTGGSGGTTGGTGGSGPPSGPPCLTAGKDLVLIGDSFIHYLNNLEPKLTQRAKTDGVLTGSDNFVDYAVPSAGLAYSSSLIGSQWSGAKSANADIKFVVMDGGGDDILLGNNMCLSDGVGKDADASCQKSVTDAVAAAAALLADMKTAGVSEVVYFFYPDVPVGGHDILGWAFTRFEQACNDASTATFHCHMLDTRPTFNGHPEYIDTDNIHPSAAGDEKLADLVWSTMKNECVAQSANSACCVP